MHAPIMPREHAGHTEVKMKEGLRESEAQKKALCLGRAVPNVPWGFGAISCPHKQ